DEHPEIRCGIRRRAQRPEGLREGVAGDEAPPVDRQHLDEAAGQALAERGRGDLLSSPPGREAPQQPNLDEHVSPLRPFRPTALVSKAQSEQYGSKEAIGRDVDTLPGSVLCAWVAETATRFAANVLSQRVGP